MQYALVAIILAWGVVPAYAQAQWTGPVGGGMVAVQEADVFSANHGACGIIQDNYDRDPLGLDVDEFRIACGVGIGRSLELYGWYYFSRAVVVPGPTPVPAPPLDIVVLSGAAPPRPPYRPMYWPLPYLGHHASSVGDMVPGDSTLGMKARVRPQHGWAPAVAISIHAIVPSTESSARLWQGSSSGSIDVFAQSAATWNVGRLSTSANISLTRLSDMKRGDRTIDASGIHEASIRRPYALRTAAGIRVRANRYLSFMGEGFQLSSIGPHTPMQDESGATDVLFGATLTVRRFSLTAAYRQHLSPPTTKVRRPTGPLAGAVDLTAVSAADRAAYLATIGAPTSGTPLRHALVVVGAPHDVRLPTGASELPPTYFTSTTGNGGATVALSVTF